MGSYQPLTYIEGRKRIYCPEYARLVGQTEAFRQLQYLYQHGCHLQLVDVDVPAEGTIITPELYRQYISNTSLSFGHAWTLGARLMGITPWLN